MPEARADLWKRALRTQEVIRDPRTGKRYAISRLIGRSLRAAIDLSVLGVLSGLFGTASAMARQGGRSTSSAKAAAARANGAKGGRPRRTAGA